MLRCLILVLLLFVLIFNSCLTLSFAEYNKETLTKFASWANANGVKVHNGIDFADFIDTGLGLIVSSNSSTGKIEAGEELFQVPVKLFLNTRAALQDQEYGAMLRAIQSELKASNQIILSLHLMLEVFRIDQKNRFEECKLRKQRSTSSSSSSSKKMVKRKKKKKQQRKQPKNANILLDLNDSGEEYEDIVIEEEEEDVGADSRNEDDDEFDEFNCDVFKSPGSPFEQWIAVLPSKSQIDTPLFFDESEFRELKGSLMQVFTTDTNSTLFKNFQVISEFSNDKFPGLFPASMTFSDFVWAYSIVSARGVSIGDNFHCLIPFLDVANIARVETQFKLSEDNTTLSVVTHSPFRKGDQVFIRMDISPRNWELLLNRGYCLEDESYDALAFLLNIKIPDDDLLQSVKSKLLEQEGLKEMNFWVITPDTLFPDQVIAAARIISLDMEDLPAVQSFVSKNSEEPKSIGSKSISLNNDLKAMKLLVRQLRSMLMQYETTIEEDNAILKTRISNKKRHAVVLRKGEKRIINLLAQQIQNIWVSHLLEKPSSQSSSSGTTPTPSS